MATYEEKDKTTIEHKLYAITLDRSDGRPLYRQLAERLRLIILETASAAGAKLPSSRAFAQELSVSRITVTTAYDHLLAEGYLTTTHGGGTYVATDLPHLSHPKPGHAAQPAPPPPAWGVFEPGLPDPRLFPYRSWARHLELAWAHPDAALMARQDGFGWLPLRLTICAHLATWRDLHCDPDQVLITSGAQEAFDIILSALIEPKARIAIEDPGWTRLFASVTHAAHRAVPVAVDARGLPPAALPRDAKAVCVTPSRHYPTGAAMPVTRRLALLDWARSHAALIIEDDYDSEFRYQGFPLPSLAGLDGLRSTLYLGSFSKLLSPDLRLGYMVLPARFVGTVRDHLTRIGPKASLTPQVALARFMETGEFATHLRRCRRNYAKRQAHLVASLKDISPALTVAQEASGMHLCCPLRGIPDKEAVQQARQKGISPKALSNYGLTRSDLNGLVLGYSAFDEAELSQACDILRSVLT